MGLLSSIVSGISAFAQWGVALFKAKNSPDVVQSAEAKKDEDTLQHTDTDLAKGDVKDLGKDIAE